MYSSDQTVDRLLRVRSTSTCFTRAHVRKVITGSSDGRMEGVRYFDSEHRERTIRAEHVVLAAQAVENIRILLSSTDKRYPNGAANSFRITRQVSHRAHEVLHHGPCVRAT